MKHLKAAALALLLALTSGYMLQDYDGLHDKTYAAALGPPPSPKLKPETWTAYQAGRLRRLSPYSFGQRKDIKAHPIAPVAPVAPALDDAPQLAHGLPSIELSQPIGFGSAVPLNLQGADHAGQYDQTGFSERLTEMAEASPIQPQKRRCAASSKKIKSVAMERQITEKTSVGVEYVYKDKCHPQSHAVLTSHALPDDTGVKLRLNMRF